MVPKHIPGSREYTKGRFRLSSMDGLEYIKVASYMLNVSEKIARDLFSPQMKSPNYSQHSQFVEEKLHRKKCLQDLKRLRR